MLMTVGQEMKVGGRSCRYAKSYVKWKVCIWRLLK